MKKLNLILASTLLLMAMHAGAADESATESRNSTAATANAPTEKLDGVCQCATNPSTILPRASYDSALPDSGTKAQPGEMPAAGTR
jgi:hypothetical protein